MTALELYNAHKRRTLDRLSHKYQLRVREVVRRELDAQASTIRQALDSAAHSFTPPTGRLRSEIERVFEKHRDDVIRVGVSDGIQEISPDKKLNLWMNHPLAMPVEDTLTRALATKRNAITPKIAKAVETKTATKIGDLVDAQLKAYLKSVKDTYRKFAADWLDGKEGFSIRDVLDALSGTLRKTDFEAAKIFRTETTSYFNQSRYHYFSENTDADYIELFAVTDGRISDICKSRHGFVVEMAKAHFKQYMPPFHPYCRTIQRALISYLPTHKRIIERGLVMSESSFVPLPHNWAA